MLAACCVKAFVKVYVSFRFKAKEIPNAVGISSLISYLQGKEIRLSLCFNTFLNANRNLNKRQISMQRTD